MSMAASQLISSRTPGLGPVAMMGVSGCGKSSVGEGIAHHRGCAFIEGDSFHSPEKVKKMSSGIALDDSDRLPCLHDVGSKLASSADIVVSCSALKKSCRDQLRMAAGFAGRTNGSAHQSLYATFASRQPIGNAQSLECFVERALSALAGRKDQLWSNMSVRGD